MSRGKNRPSKEHFIEWFDSKEKMADYYGIKKSSVSQQYSVGKVIYVYYKKKSNTMRGYSRKKVYVRTEEVLYYLQTEWYIGVDEFDWEYSESSIKRKWDWITQMCMLSSTTKGKIREELIDKIYEIVKQHWTNSDRYRIKRILDDVKEYGKKTEDIWKEKKAREIIESHQWYKPPDEKRAQRWWFW